MIIKTAEELAIIKAGGAILASVRQTVAAAAKEGVPLAELDELAKTLFQKTGGVPAFLGYRPEGARRPYPAAICTSVNEVVVHGLPGNYRLRSGDVLKIDLGLHYRGFFTDTAITVGIGKLAPSAEKLISAVEEALTKGIAVCRSGNTTGDIGAAIAKSVRTAGFSVIKGLTGHGIGRELHEDPIIFNEGRPGTGMVLKPGMLIAVEPMISAGSPHIRQLADESYATSDGSLSAHVEHTILITEAAPEILTK